MVNSLLLRRPIKWAATVEKAITQDEQRKERERRKQKVYRAHEYATLESMQRMNNSGRLRLESLEGAFRYLFANSDLKLGYMQEQLIREITIAFLKNMFKDDLVSNLKYLTEKFKITHLFDTLAALYPRRSGKSVACQVALAVIAVSQPNMNQVVYNLTAAQAEEFLTETRKYLNVFQDSPEYGWIMEREDVRKLVRFTSRKYGTSNSIKAYACALKGDGKIDKTIIAPLSLLFILVHI